MSDMQPRSKRAFHQSLFFRCMLGIAVGTLLVGLAGHMVSHNMAWQLQTVVYLLALVVFGVLVRRQLAQPLTALLGAVGAIRAREFARPVPHVDRGDEIGDLGRGLDEMRQALAEAETRNRQAALQAAAFNGSSAALMMVDADFQVVFANPACRALMTRIEGDLRAHWPEFSADAVIGESLGRCAPLAGMVARCRTEGAGFAPEVSMLRIGDDVFKVTLSVALCSGGDVMGAVVEWADRTAAQRNAAMMGAIDATQVRCEFDAGGTVRAANDRMLALLDTEAGGLRIGDFLRSKIQTGADAATLLARVMSGETVQGRFELVRPGSGSRHVVDGSLAPVREGEGQIEACLFLGMDVTEADGQMRRSEEERARNASQQQDVVAALGLALKALAEGDLECAIDTAFPPDYEKLRHDFNAAVESLRLAVGAVAQNAVSIRSETSEITTAADDLSRRTERQAATLEQTAAALDELTASVRSAAEGADEASTMSAEAQSSAAEGGEVARQAVAAMDAIKTSSQEISKITSVIDDIAFQTNLLALNAGVEAARAGEAGRGFAVVATEVRALAQRSSDAASEINALISSSGDQVQRGVDLVDRTGTALSAIVSSIADISKRVSSIATSAREQAIGLAEINTAVNELDHVTQQNAAMFEETTAASHALTAEADALTSAVSRFRMKETVQTAVRPQPAPKPAAPAPMPRDPVAARPVAAGNLAVKQAPEFDESAGWEEF